MTVTTKDINTDKLSIIIPRSNVYLLDSSHVYTVNVFTGSGLSRKVIKNNNDKNIEITIETLPIMLVLILVLKGLKRSNNEPTNGEMIIISADQYILSFQPRNIFNINTIFISI